VRNGLRLQALAVLVLTATGWLLAGCKAAPELTSDQAKTLIQAKYDKDPGFVYNVSVDDRGMQLGVHANYWLGVKRYPNGYWGDFKLTDEGKKAVKLPNGGDVIQWRPEGPSDAHYVIVVVPLAVSHLKVRGAGDVESLGDTKTVAYMEDVDLTGMPDALQNIAHNAVNKLSTKRVATFVVTDGAWALKSIE